MQIVQCGHVHAHLIDERDHDASVDIFQAWIEVLVHVVFLQLTQRGFQTFTVIGHVRNQIAPLLDTQLTHHGGQVSRLEFHAVVALAAEGASDVTDHGLEWRQAWVGTHVRLPAPLIGNLSHRRSCHVKHLGLSNRGADIVGATCTTQLGHERFDHDGHRHSTQDQGIDKDADDLFATHLVGGHNVLEGVPVLAEVLSRSVDVAALPRLPVFGRLAVVEQFVDFDNVTLHCVDSRADLVHLNRALLPVHQVVPHASQRLTQVLHDLEEGFLQGDQDGTHDAFVRYFEVDPARLFGEAVERVPRQHALDRRIRLSQVSDRLDISPANKPAFVDALESREDQFGLFVLFAEDRVGDLITEPSFVIDALAEINFRRFNRECT
ncbi:hypothetical protein D3C86_1371600 [compost metagenome]